jgi:hypothetical protein
MGGIFSGGGVFSGRPEDPQRRHPIPSECQRVTVRDYLAAGRPARYGLLSLTADRTPFGWRPWFACPRCGRRARVLYRPPVGRPDRRWACRACHQVTSRSRREKGREHAMRPGAVRAYRILAATDGDWDAALAAMRTEVDFLGAVRLALQFDREILREREGQRRAARRAAREAMRPTPDDRA